MSAVKLHDVNEPTDEDFAVILADVTKVAAQKAAIAQANFFGQIASEINAKYHVQSAPSLS